MDKGAIEKFAVTARVKLRQSVGQRMAVLGIGADGALASVQIIGDVVQWHGDPFNKRRILTS